MATGSERARSHDAHHAHDARAGGLGRRPVRAGRLRVTRLIAGVALLSWSLASRAAADNAPEFAKGTWIAGFQATGGVQNNIQQEPSTSDITFAGGTLRGSYLPFAPFGADWYGAALEPGLELWFQQYLEPKKAVGGGLKAALRLHAIGLGPVIPYLEGTAGIGGTSLNIRESRSTLTFVLEAGAGASMFVAPNVAVNLGYRLQHQSNGGTSQPNRGLNSHTGVLGMSYFFH
jgi:opacity protein-like surface antigen